MFITGHLVRVHAIGGVALVHCGWPGLRTVSDIRISGRDREAGKEAGKFAEIRHKNHKHDM